MLELCGFDKKKYSQNLIRQYLMNDKINEYFVNDHRVLCRHHII